MKTIDIDRWSRKAQFLNFIQFDDPFFNICGEVKVNELKAYTAQHGISFFLASYYGVLKTVNELEAFRYRIRGEEVVLHDKIGGSCTILKDDGNFGYGYFEYSESFADFVPQARAVIAAIKGGEPFAPRFEVDDLIHSSVIPWISFTSFQHARRLKKGDSIPKIVLGKLHQRGADWYLPVSVSGHHALMDGLHAGQFFEAYEAFSAEVGAFLGG